MKHKDLTPSHMKESRFVDCHRSVLEWQQWQVIKGKNLPHLSLTAAEATPKFIEVYAPGITGVIDYSSPGRSKTWTK